MTGALRRKNLLLFCLFNLLALLTVLAFLFYSRFALSEDSPLFCIFKVLFKGYCPFCGGTRAVNALTHLDVISALRFHAYVVFFALFTVFYEIRVFVRIAKGHPHPFWIPGWAGWGLLILLGVFFIVRNVLLWGAGIDWIGDFLPPPF